MGISRMFKRAWTFPTVEVCFLFRIVMLTVRDQQNKLLDRSPLDLLRQTCSRHLPSAMLLTVRYFIQQQNILILIAEPPEFMYGLDQGCRIMIFPTLPSSFYAMLSVFQIHSQIVNLSFHTWTLHQDLSPFRCLLCLCLPVLRNLNLLFVRDTIWPQFQTAIILMFQSGHTHCQGQNQPDG